MNVSDPTNCVELDQSKLDEIRPQLRDMLLKVKAAGDDTADRILGNGFGQIVAMDRGASAIMRGHAQKAAFDRLFQGTGAMQTLLVHSQQFRDCVNGMLTEIGLDHLTVSVHQTA